MRGRLRRECQRRVQSQHRRVIDVELQADTPAGRVDDVGSHCKIGHAVAGRIDRIDHFEQGTRARRAEDFGRERQVLGQPLHGCGLLRRCRASGQYIADLLGSERLCVLRRPLQFRAVLWGAIGQARRAERARISTQRCIDQNHLDTSSTRRACQRGRRVLVGILDLHCRKACRARRGEALEQRQFPEKQRDVRGQSEHCNDLAGVVAAWGQCKQT